MSKNHIRLKTLQAQLLLGQPKKRAASIPIVPKPSLLLQSQKTIQNQILTQSSQNQLQKFIKKSSKQLLPLIPIKLTSINQSKQYQTKLSISSEKWMVYCFEKKAYKRGWKPAQIGEFTGFLRLLIFKIYNILQQQHEEIKKLNIHTNTAYLRQQISVQKIKNDKRLSSRKKEGFILQNAIKRGLQNNMIINIEDLMIGLLMTNFDDLVEYALIYVGYLCYCTMNNIDFGELNKKQHYINKISQAKLYVQSFEKYTQQYFFPSHKMLDSSFKSVNLSLSSSLNNICTLYLSLQSNPLFKQIIEINEHISKIKYQLGYYFWQNRTIKWKNQRLLLNCTQKKQKVYEFVANWRGIQYYSSLVVNRQLNILIILQQCKFGMLQRDIKVIQKWVRDIRKPIVGEPRMNTLDIKSTKLKPLLKIADGHFPVSLHYNRNQLKRVNTQS